MSEIDYRIKYHKYKSKYDNLIMQGGAAAATDLVRHKEAEQNYFGRTAKVRVGDIVYSNKLSSLGDYRRQEIFPWHGIVLSEKAVQILTTWLKEAANQRAWQEKAAIGGDADIDNANANVELIQSKLIMPVVAIGDVTKFLDFVQLLKSADRRKLVAEIPKLELPRKTYLATRSQEGLACIQGFDLSDNDLVLLGRKLNYQADLIVRANEQIEQQEFKLYRRPFQGEPLLSDTIGDAHVSYFESLEFPFAQEIIDSGLRNQLFVTREQEAAIKAKSGTGQITWQAVRDQALSASWEGARYGGPGEPLHVGSLIEIVDTKNGGNKNQIGQILRIE